MMKKTCQFGCSAMVFRVSFSNKTTYVRKALKNLYMKICTVHALQIKKKCTCDVGACLER